MSQKRSEFNSNEFYGNIVKKMAENLKDGKMPPINLAYQLKKSESGFEGAEALLRHEKVDGYQVAPFYLFEEIRAYDEKHSRKKGENTHDLEKALTFAELEMLCRDLEKNIDSLGKDFCISLNVNPEIFNKEFVETYQNILKKHPKLDAKNVGIELVETSKYTVPSDVKNNFTNDEREKTVNKIREFYKNMARLQKEGAVFSLDDFDSGELREIGQEVLETYPFDVVKFDRDLVGDLSKRLVKAECTKNKNEKAYSLTNNVLARAVTYMEGKKKLNRPLPKQLVFEGVEEEHLSYLPDLIVKHYGTHLKDLGVKDLVFRDME